MKTAIAARSDESGIRELLSKYSVKPIPPDDLFHPIEAMVDPTSNPLCLVGTADSGDVVGVMNCHLSQTPAELVAKSMCETGPSVEGLPVDRSDEVAFLSCAYIAPEFQGNGIGSRLLTELLSVAIRAEHDYACAEAWEYDSSRDGRKLLQSYDFELAYRSPIEFPYAGDCRICGPDCDCTVGVYARPLQTRRNRESQSRQPDESVSL